MDQAVKNQFIQDKITSVIWRHSFPMFSAILALFAYDLLESSLIALSGAQTLASLGFTLPITTAMTAIAIGVSIKTNNQVVKHACLSPEQLSSIILRLILSATVAIGVATLLILPFSDNLLTLLGNKALTTSSSSTDIAVFSAQQNYIDLRLLSWVFLVLVWQTNAILRALGKMKLASGIMLAWLALKASLAIILLTPESYFYQDGLTGLACVHIISDSICFVLSFILIAHRYNYFRCANKQNLFKIKLPDSDTLLIIGQQIITPISMAAITLIAANMGQSYVAAFALIFRLEALFLLLPMVLTTSLPAIIGTNFWSGHFQRVREIYAAVFSLIIIVQLIIALMILVNKDLLASFICPQDQVVAHIQHYLLWVPWAYFGAGAVIVYQSCLNAEGKPLQAAHIGFVHRIVLLIPFTLLGTVIPATDGFYQGILLGHLFAGLYVFYLFWKKSQHKNALHWQQNNQPLTLTEERE